MHPTIIAALALLGLAAGAPAVAPLVPAAAASPDSTAQATTGEEKPAPTPSAVTAKGAAQGGVMKTATGQDVVVLETKQGDKVNPARASSGSQFFIDLAPQPSLDAGGYTVFGEVIRGMDAVDKIAALANEPGLTSAAGGGVNPQQKAAIKRAYVAPLSRFEKPAAAPKAAPAPSAGAATVPAADTTKQ